LPVLAGMLAVGILAVLGQFGFEATKTKKLLEELFLAVTYDERFNRR
jgi:hypothetical protein